MPEAARNDDVRDTAGAPDPGPAGRPLRLLILAEDGFPPPRVDVAHLFGREMVGRGHRIDFILQSRSACPKAHVSRWNGCDVWVGATDPGGSRQRRLRKHLLDLRNDLRVFSLVAAARYDAVIVKDKFISALLALIATRIRGVPFVYWLSYPFPEASLASVRDRTARYPWLYRLRGIACGFLLYRLILPGADHVFVQSEQMKRDVADKGIAPDVMTSIPMGVCMDAFPSAAGPRRRLPEGTPCIVYLGTLIRIRRLDFLVRVLAIVRRYIPAARLYFVGRGDDDKDEQALIDEAERHDVLDGVVLTGHKDRSEALEYVREADVCVSPFYPTPILNSTSPTKLIEYMAVGRPVVANDHPEQRLVIEQSGAGHCVAYDEPSFARAIVDLIGNPDAAARMGEQGRRYVAAKRDYRIIAQDVERELTRIALRRAGRSRSKFETGH